MIISEICCGSYYDALVAEQAKADRIELNSALELGGLTPSIATLQLTKANTTLKVIAMVRPRGSGFIYSKEEKEVMMLEAKQLLDNKADGLAFGFLTNTLEVDLAATKAMVELIHFYGKEAVFHRAFDQAADPFKAIEDLIACKVDRILTSGQQAAAVEGTFLLKQLHERFGNQIALLAGGGVTHHNCQLIMKETGIFEYHSSCKEFVIDLSTVANVSYSSLSNENKSSYIRVSQNLAKEFVQKVKQLHDFK